LYRLECVVNLILRRHWVLDHEQFFGQRLLDDESKHTARTERRVELPLVRCHLADLKDVVFCVDGFGPRRDHR